jgi:hypothetical protein
MAKIYDGILGKIYGKVGSVVGSKWKGLNTIRIYQPKPHNPKTKAQEIQRSKFKLLVELGKKCLPFIRIGLANAYTKMTSSNSFVKMNISTAISGTYPAFTINYPNLVVAAGTLTGIDTVAVANAAGRKVTLTWTDNTGEGSAEGTDVANILLINSTKGLIIQDTSSAVRSTGTLTFTCPLFWLGETVYAYIAFVNPTTGIISNSSYAGTTTVLL